MLIAIEGLVCFRLRNFHYKTDIAHIPLDIVFALATQHEQHEIYMANARILRSGPSATYIPHACIGGWHWG